MMAGGLLFSSSPASSMTLEHIIGLPLYFHSNVDTGQQTQALMGHWTVLTVMMRMVISTDWSLVISRLVVTGQICPISN